MKMTILSLLILFNWKIVIAKGKSLHLMEHPIPFLNLTAGKASFTIRQTMRTQ